MVKEPSDKEPEAEQDTEGKNQRFSSRFRKPLANLRPEHYAKGKEKAEAIDERIRNAENKASEIKSKSKFIAANVKETSGKVKAAFQKGNRRERIKENFRERFARLGTRFRTTDFGLIGTSTGKRILEPKFIPGKYFDVPKTAKWMAALFLPIIIIVTLALVEALNQIVEEILLNGGDLGDQSAIFSFFSTFLALVFFIFGAYFWFLWVRTGGFKLFDT